MEYWNVICYIVSNFDDLKFLGALKDVSDGCACCNKHAIFQDYVWQDIQQMDDGKFDYLLVETSGVTDPLSIIASLEKNFGKLFRAHLDTVVTVV